MRINVVLALLKKEFLNIIRDRKSFIITILLPLLMFPLLLGLMSLMLTAFTTVEDTITFGVNYDVGSDFQSFIDSYDENFKFEIIYDNEKNLKKLFDDNDLSIYVIKENDTYKVHYDENNTGNIATTTLVESIYKDYRDHYITNELLAQGIDYEKVKSSFDIVFVQESITEMGSLIPSLISMSLIMVISSVCFSVAIDVTTSEKEKGTLETLLSLPIKKAELITSKFLTVCSLSVLSGLLAYVSLFGTLLFSKKTLALLGVTAINVDLKLLGIYFIAIILVSFLFSGLLLSVTIFSKNLKEAQNSLYPMELFVSFISLLPMFGINANLKYALIPFVNISLLFNNALSTNINSMFVIITFVSTIVYSLLLIRLVSRIYSEEDVLFSTKSMNYMIFDKGRTRTICFTPITSILIAVIIYLLSLYFSLLFITVKTTVLLAITPLTIIFVIVIASLLARFDFKKGFKINKFSFHKLYVTFMLYVGTYILSNTVVNIVCKIFPTIVENFSKYEELLNIDNVFVGILLIALLPAIAEELLFRGVIFNSFNKKYKPIIAIIVSAIIFGIYHMNWVQGINAAILGCMLAYGYYKTGSIFVPIIIHFINNSFAVIMDYYHIFNFEMPLWGTFILVFFGLVIVGSCIYIFEEELDKN